MNRRGVLCEEVYHVLQFPSPALSVSGNMGIISACGTYCIGTWQAPLCIRGTKIGKVRELYKWKNRRESLRGGFDSTIFHQLCCNYLPGRPHQNSSKKFIIAKLIPLIIFQK